MLIVSLSVFDAHLLFKNKTRIVRILPVVKIRRWRNLIRCIVFYNGWLGRTTAPARCTIPTYNNLLYLVGGLCFHSIITYRFRACVTTPKILFMRPLQLLYKVRFVGRRATHFLTCPINLRFCLLIKTIPLSRIKFFSTETKLQCKTLRVNISTKETIQYSIIRQKWKCTRDCGSCWQLTCCSLYLWAQTSALSLRGHKIRP